MLYDVGSHGVCAVQDMHLKVLVHLPCSQDLSLDDFHVLFHPFRKHDGAIDSGWMMKTVVMVECSGSTLGKYLPRGSWCVSVTSASVPRETIFNGLYTFSQNAYSGGVMCMFPQILTKFTSFYWPTLFFCFLSIVIPFAYHLIMFRRFLTLYLSFITIHHAVMMAHAWGSQFSVTFFQYKYRYP
jgi:hypothetical protein